MKKPEDQQKDNLLTKEEHMQMLRNSGLEDLEAEWQRLDIYDHTFKEFMQDLLADLQQQVDEESLKNGQNDVQLKKIHRIYFNAKDLIAGDYVLIQFNSKAYPQLARVIDVDHAVNTAELLPEGQTNTIKINSEDKWQHIFPYGIESKLLIKYGFSPISEEIAYGDTVDSWTMNTHGGKYIFNLVHEVDATWSIEAIWLEGNESLIKTYKGLFYIHHVHQVVKRHITQQAIIE